MPSTSVNTAPQNLSETESVEQASGGDHTAFTLLMRRYNRLLYRTARSIVKNDAEAEDILQEAYLRAYSALRTFRGDSSLSTWLTRIVINEALGSLRKAARRAEIVEFGSTPRWAADAPEVQMDVFEEPEKAAMRAQARELIEAKGGCPSCCVPDGFCLARLGGNDG
jgi:RNA polymerase sigma-70 factor, ECF subfamily